MASANTKLDKFQKTDLRDFKAKMSKNMAFAQNGALTALVMVQHNCVLVSTAIAAPDEEKVRVKVGEWYAMEHMQERQYVALPKQEWMQDCSAKDIAEELVNTFQ